jgi:hypothetical protein
MIRNADVGLGSLQVKSLLQASEFLIKTGNTSFVLAEKQKLLHDLHTYMTSLCAAKDQKVSVGEWQLPMQFMTCTLCTSKLLSGNLMLYVTWLFIVSCIVLNKVLAKLFQLEYLFLGIVLNVIGGAVCLEGCDVYFMCNSEHCIFVRKIIED